MKIKDVLLENQGSVSLDEFNKLKQAIDNTVANITSYGTGALNNMRSRPIWDSIDKVTAHRLEIPWTSSSGKDYIIEVEVGLYKNGEMSLSIVTPKSRLNVETADETDPNTVLDKIKRVLLALGF